MIVTKLLASQGIFDMCMIIIIVCVIGTLPEQCTDSDASTFSKSYFSGFHDQLYASTFAKSFSSSVYYFTGFHDMDRYRKFGPFYFMYFVSVRQFSTVLIRPSDMLGVGSDPGVLGL